MTEETLFHEALAKPPSERAGFLDNACAGQPQLRAAVEALLLAHEASGSLLDRPVGGLGQPVDTDLAPGNPVATGEFTPEPGETPDTLVPTVTYSASIGSNSVIAGRYVLQEKIGEGGMGEVWVAKQTEPVKRKSRSSSSRRGWIPRPCWHASSRSGRRWLLWIIPTLPASLMAD